MVRDPDRPGKFRLGNTQRLEKLLDEHLTRPCRRTIFRNQQCAHFCGPFLVIIDNFNLGRALFRPDEADPELIVETDGILALAVAM
jgi:hypothetical protein